MTAHKKSPPKPALRKPSHGRGMLLTGGKPGNSGGTGRPPDAFKQLCRELASGERTVASVREILNDPTHTQFVSALRWASEHGYGKPTQPVDLTLNDSLATRLQRARERTGR